VEQEIAVEEVKSRSAKGIIVLTGRTFILQLISFAAQLFLFAYLDISDFGIFALVSAVVNFLTYFSDIGLAASLIQKKSEPTLQDYRTTFTIQQTLVLILIILLFLFSGKISGYYDLNINGLYLLYALGISLFLSSLKSIPSVILERKLEFTKLVIPQVAEQIIYNVSLVLLAMNGFGIASFTYSVLLRSFAGLIIIYYISPWKVGFDFSISSLKELFKFGIPYQLNTFLATIKDDGMTIVLGSILGSTGIGILSFAQRIGRYPLTFFMDAVTKVTFPAFSRLQDSKNDLEKTVTRSIFFICFLVFPSLVSLVILLPVITEVIPRYSKWSAAFWPLLLISINYMFAAATTQLTNLLSAIGKIKITFFLMIMWTVLTWIFVPFLAYKFGVNGASSGYMLVGLSSVAAVVIAKRYVDFSIIDSIIKPLLGSIIMGVTLIVSTRLLPYNFNSLIMLVIIGGVSYLISMVSIIGVSLIEDAKKSFKQVFNK